MDIMNSSGGAAASSGATGAASSGPGPAGPGPAGPSLPGAGAPATSPIRATTPFLPVTVNAVTPSSTAGMDVHAVMDILHNLDVEGVREAAIAHTALGETLDRIVENLVANGQTLAGSWQGDAAQAAVDTFQQMHSQAAQLAAQAKQTGQTLHWTANVMEQYRNLPNPLGGSAPATQPSSVTIGDVVAAIAGAAAPSAAHQAKANTQAQKYLDELNQHLVTANNAMPSAIGHTSAAASGSGHAAGAAAGAPGGAGRAVSAPTPGAYPGAGAGARSLSGAGGPSFTPAPHAVSAARLQSSAIPGGSATLTPPGPAAPSAPAGAGPIPGMMPGPAAAPSSASDGSLGNTTNEDESAEADSQLASTSEAENRGTAIGDRKQDTGTGEGAGVPMMGAPGVGQPEQERQRESWMNEDRDIWGMPQGTVGPEIGSH